MKMKQSNSKIFGTKLKMEQKLKFISKSPQDHKSTRCCCLLSHEFHFQHHIRHYTLKWIIVSDYNSLEMEEGGKSRLKSLC
mgnify:CR=1 FL=1